MVPSLKFRPKPKWTLRQHQSDVATCHIINLKKKLNRLKNYIYVYIFFKKKLEILGVATATPLAT